MPIFADESLQRLGDVAALKDAFTGINIKLMKCTGMREAWKMVTLAHALGMRVMVGCMTETSCAISAASQFSPLVDFADLDGNLLISNDRFKGCLLYTSRLAPSACNAQPWKFVVITDKELAQKAGKAAAGLGMNKFAKDAPVHILVVEESANITSLLGGKVKGKHFPLIDIGIVAAHIALAAEAEGLGSCCLLYTSIRMPVRHIRWLLWSD